MPEIRLHRAGPRSGLRHLAAAVEGFGTPYWAYEWGGGLALARHVLDRPATVAGRRVLDLGTGSGLVAIATAKAGAASVLAADVDPCAIAAARLNAVANGVAIRTALGDPTASPPPVDLVLVGDLFYDPDLARRVTVFLDRCLAAGVTALVGDPGRAFLPRSRLRRLADHPGPDFGTAAGERHPNAVFRFVPDADAVRRPSRKVSTPASSA